MTTKSLSLIKTEKLFNTNSFVIRKIYETKKFCRFFLVDHKKSCKSFFVRIPNSYEIYIKQRTSKHVDIFKVDSSVYSYYSNFLKQIKPTSCAGVVSLTNTNLYIQTSTQFEVYKLKAIYDIEEPEIKENNDVVSKINKILKPIENEEIYEPDDVTEKSEVPVTTEHDTNELAELLEDDKVTDISNADISNGDISDEEVEVEIIFEDDIDTNIEDNANKISNETGEVILSSSFVMYDLAQVYDRIKILSNELDTSIKELHSSMKTYRRDKFTKTKNNATQIFNSLYQSVNMLENKLLKIENADEKLSSLYSRSLELEDKNVLQTITAEQCKLRNEYDKTHNEILVKIINFSKIVDHLLEVNSQ